MKKSRPFPVSITTLETIKKFFKRKKYPFTEDGLIKAIEANKSKYDVYWATIGLRSMGTNKSVPVLKKLWDYPMQDVKSTSVLTVAHIAGEDETEYYASLLENPKYKEKIYAMWAISVSGNREGLPAALNFSEKVLARKVRQYNVQEIVSYLQQYQEEKEVKEMISKLNLFLEGQKKLKVKKQPKSISKK